jgi:hypothetical protein
VKNECTHWVVSGGRADSKSFGPRLQIFWAATPNLLGRDSKSFGPLGRLRRGGCATCSTTTTIRHSAHSTSSPRTYFLGVEVALSLW